MARRVFVEDPYVRSVSTLVERCTPTASGFEVLLEAELLYPVAGGQPSDRGTVAGQPVLELARAEDGRAIHVLSEPVQGEVEVVLDWPRRYDHMQQHTAQHLLTAVILESLGFRTTAFHLGERHCDIELNTPGLSTAQLDEIRERVNQSVRQALPVTCRTVDKAEYDRLDVRTRGLPEGFCGPFRLVEIRGLDRNTCGGTHVACTAELQAVVLAGTEALRGGTRLFFLAGGRVVTGMAQALEREQAWNGLLSCGPPDHLAAVEKLQNSSRVAQRRVHKLGQELGETLGRGLKTDSGLASLHRSEGDMAFLKAIASAFAESHPGEWALLTAGEGSGVFVLVGPPDRLMQVGAKVAKVLQGRGGGGGGLFQGKAGGLGGRERALELVRRTAAGGVD